MGYVYLFTAIGLELIGTTLLKYSAGFTRLVPSIGCLFFYGICFYLFARSLNYIYLGVAYATWSGVGIIASTLISWFIFNEKINAVGMISLLLIITGCVTLNLFGTK